MFANKKILIAIVSIILVVAAGIWIFIGRGMEQPAQNGAPVKIDQESSSEMTVNFHQLATKSNSGDILKLSMSAIDEANRKMYVVGTKTTYVGVIDLNTDTLVETFDIGIQGSFLFFIDKKLHMMLPDFSRCWRIDPMARTTQTVDYNYCDTNKPTKDAKKWGGYSFSATGSSGGNFNVGWRQDLDAAYGVIEIRDSANKKVGEIPHGPDADYFDIDSTTGKLYATETGNGTVNVFDLNKLASTNYCANNACWTKEIAVGHSVEQVIVDSSENIYARSRIGGSEIYKYNFAAKTLTTITNEKVLSGGEAMRRSNGWNGGGIGMWPTDMALSKDESRLFVLSHYGALIDVIDTVSGNILSKIKFYPAYLSLLPRTDAISSMVLDKTHNKIFAAFPELGVIGAVDVLKAKVTGIIDLKQYGYDTSDPTKIGGPGLIMLAVNERNDKLYVYSYNQQKLFMFNANTLVKENEASVSLDKKLLYGLISNDDKDVVCLGNKILNASTLKQTGSFAKGTVVAFNNDANAVYLTEAFPANAGKQQEKIYEFINNNHVKEWTLDMIGSIPSTFYFDFKKNAFYVAYFTSGVVKKYSLSGGVAPSAADLAPPDGKTSSSASCSDLNGDGKIDSIEQQKCTGSASGKQSGGTAGSGKCGDGVCEDVEKGKCTADCR